MTRRNDGRSRVLSGLRVALLAMIAAVSTVSAISLSSLAVSSVALADARTDYLIRLLTTSDAFRVRAQAAISLGSVTPAADVVDALTTALRDENPAVRAAAATSLGRVGGPPQLTALRALERDAEVPVRTAATQAIAALSRRPATGTAVAAPSTGTTTTTTGATPTPSGPPRYYVGIGAPGSRVASVDPGVVRQARAFIERTVGGLPGVVVAPADEAAASATRVIRERSLAGVFLDSSITVLEQRADGAVRATVSVVVQTYPDRNMRSMLSGSATVSGESATTAQRTAIEAALGSALRNLPVVMAASAASPGGGGRR